MTAHAEATSPTDKTFGLEWVERGTSGALYSLGGRVYRYVLTRQWSEATSPLVVIGLNPSTATEIENDPTITRAIGFAQRWGCGGLVMLNAFAFRSTDPHRLRRVFDPVGRANDRVLDAWTADATMIVCAWGAHAKYMDRGITVARRLQSLGRPLYCFGQTAAGDPKHPLYLKSTTQPVRYVVTHA